MGLYDVVTGFFEDLWRRFVGRELRAVAFRESNGKSLVWIGQCLEIDICAQGATLAELRERLRETVEAEIFVARKLDLDVFDIPPAPDKFFKMFNASPDRRIYFNVPSLPARF